MAEMCSNCNNNADRGVTTTSIIKSDDSDGVIKMWDIIAYVYRIDKISLDDFKIQFKKNHQECDSMDTYEKCFFGMCDLCLSLLSDSYKALKQFEALTHQSSFIQHIQATYKNKWEEDCRNIETSFIPSSSSLISSFDVKTGDENLFDSFNFDDGHPLDELEERYTDEFKYDTIDGASENEWSSVLPQSSVSMVDLNSEKTGRKISLEKTPKLSFVKIERMSEEDVKYYNTKKRAKTKSSSQMIQRKTEDLEYHNAKTKTKMDPAVMEVVQLKRRKIKPVQKLQFPITIKKQKKKQSSTPKDNLSRKSFTDGATFLKYYRKSRFRDMKCKICSKVLTSARSIDKHMKIVHKQANEEEKEKYFQACELCGKTVRTDVIKSHMKIHGPKEILKCDKCDKEYLDKRSYEDHIKTHSDNYTPYLCRHCGSIFNDRQTLYIHERNHTAEKKLSCEICSKTYSVKSALEIHMVIHSKEKPYVCEQCGMSYSQKTNLIRHKKVHKDVAEKGEYSSKCQFCERIFKHSISLQNHMKIHEKKYKCSFCGKILSKLCVLKNHEDLHKKNPDYQPRKYKSYQSVLPHQLDHKPNTSN